MEETVDIALTAESPAESKFAAVVFRNIQEVYSPGKDIRCCYSIKPFVLPTPNDWIGLYKVGWQSYKEYICYEYSPVIQRGISNSDSMSSQNSVLFRGSKLPPEEVEFYQFCYVTSAGEIRGASYPFQIQFSKPGQLECSEEEDENGDTLLVVSNRTTMLEDSLAKAFDENASLKASKEKGEEDCVLFQDMILQLEGQKNTMNTQLQEQKKAYDEVQREKMCLEESLNESVKKVTNLEQALHDAREKTLALQKSVEVEKLRSVQTDEDQKKLEEERMQLLQDASDSQMEVDKLQELVEKKNSKISALEGKDKKIMQENEVLIEEHENMLGEMKTTQASLGESQQESLALERSLADHLEHMNLVQKENYKLKQELDGANEEIDQVSAAFNDESDRANKTHLKERKCLEEEVEKLAKRVQDGERARSDAEETIEKILGKLEEEKAMRQQLIQDYEDSISNIQEQLNQERAFNNSLSSASDRQVAELQELLNVQLGKNAAACQQIELKIQETKRLEEEVKANEKVISTMEESINEAKHELESAKSYEREYLLSNATEKNGKPEQNSALDGPYFALQTAHAQLKKQYLQVKKDVENLWMQKGQLKRQLTTLQSELPDSDLRFQMANLKKQIEDLRIRLNMGAEAYKAKFKECRKYQSQLKKVQKDVSGRSTPQSPLPESVSEFEIRNLKQSLEDEKTTTAAIKKSLDNYKKEAHEAKEELEQTKRETEVLRSKVGEVERDLLISHEEKERRLVEDKELQSHIECLHRELQTRTEAMKTAEGDFKKTSEEKEGAIAALVEENESLRDDVGRNTEEMCDLTNDNDVLREEVLKQKKMVEDIHSELVLRKRETPEREQPSAPLLTDESCPQHNPGLMSSTNTQNVCPVCLIYYPPNSPQDKFESHVQSHFSD